VSEDEIVALRMLVPECNEICGIEIVRRPFALDGCWSLSEGGDDKVYLVPALVAHIVALNVTALAAGTKGISNQFLAIENLQDSAWVRINLKRAGPSGILWP
jgi:hypothetical protein